MMGEHVFEHDDNEYAWHSRPFQSRQVKRRKRPRKKAKVNSTAPEEHSLVKNKHRILHDGQKGILLGGLMDMQVREAFSQGNEGFQKDGFSH